MCLNLTHPPKRLYDLTENFNTAPGVFFIHCVEETLAQPLVGALPFAIYFFTHFLKREEVSEENPCSDSLTFTWSPSGESLQQLCKGK